MRDDDQQPKGQQPLCPVSTSSVTHGKDEQGMAKRDTSTFKRAQTSHDGPLWHARRRECGEAYHERAFLGGGARPLSLVLSITTSRKR